jgi:hypothetical protein
LFCTIKKCFVGRGNFLRAFASRGHYAGLDNFLIGMKLPGYFCGLVLALGLDTADITETLRARHAELSSAFQKNLWADVQAIFAKESVLVINDDHIEAPSQHFIYEGLWRDGVRTLTMEANLVVPKGASRYLELGQMSWTHDNSDSGVCGYLHEWQLNGSSLYETLEVSGWRCHWMISDPVQKTSPDALPLGEGEWWEKWMRDFERLYDDGNYGKLAVVLFRPVSFVILPNGTHLSSQDNLATELTQWRTAGINHLSFINSDYFLCDGYSHNMGRLHGTDWLFYIRWNQAQIIDCFIVYDR